MNAVPRRTTGERAAKLRQQVRGPFLIERKPLPGRAWAKHASRRNREIKRKLYPDLSLSRINIAV